MRVSPVFHVSLTFQFTVYLFENFLVSNGHFLQFGQVSFQQIVDLSHWNAISTII